MKRDIDYWSDLIGRIAHEHLELPEIRADDESESFPIDLCQCLTRRYLPEILDSDASALIRPSIIRYEKEDTPFVLGMDHLFRHPPDSEQLSRQFDAYLTYVLAAYTITKSHSRVGMASGMVDFFKDFSGTAIVKAELRFEQKHGHILELTVDAMPLLHLRQRFSIAEPVLSAFATLRSAVHESKMRPALNGGASADHDSDFARLLVLRPSNSDAISIDEAAESLIDSARELAAQRNEPDWIHRDVSALSRPLPEIGPPQIESQDAEYLRRYERFVCNVPLAVLAGYLHHSGTPHALYVTPSTVLMQRADSFSRRIEEGTFSLLVSTKLDSGAIQAVKTLALRLWGGLSQQRAATIAQKLEALNRTRLITKTVYGVGHPLSKRFDRVIARIADVETQVGSTTAIVEARETAKRAKRVSLLMQLLSNLGKFAPDNLRADVFYSKSDWIPATTLRLFVDWLHSIEHGRHFVIDQASWTSVDKLRLRPFLPKHEPKHRFYDELYEEAVFEALYNAFYLKPIRAARRLGFSIENGGPKGTGASTALIISNECDHKRLRIPTGQWLSSEAFAAGDGLPFVSQCLSMSDAGELSVRCRECDGAWWFDYRLQLNGLVVMHDEVGHSENSHGGDL